MQLKIKLLFLINICAVLLVATCVFATTYYVDQGHGSASDGNAGTDPELPWLTLDHATDTVDAGDTVIVKAGTYIKTDQGVNRYNTFNCANTGTSGNPITFQSSPRGAAILKSKSLPSDRTYYAVSILDRDCKVSLELTGTMPIRLLMRCANAVAACPITAHFSAARRFSCSVRSL